MYDKRGEGRADSAEFLKDFWQTGREGRERQARRRLQMVRNLNVRPCGRLLEMFSCHFVGLYIIFLRFAGCGWSSMSLFEMEPNACVYWLISFSSHINS